MVAFLPAWGVIGTVNRNLRSISRLVLAAVHRMVVRCSTLVAASSSPADESSEASRASKTSCTNVSAGVALETIVW